MEKAESLFRAGPTAPSLRSSMIQHQRRSPKEGTTPSRRSWPGASISFVMKEKASGFSCPKDGPFKRSSTRARSMIPKADSESSITDPKGPGSEELTSLQDRRLGAARGVIPRLMPIASSTRTPSQDNCKREANALQMFVFILHQSCALSFY